MKRTVLIITILMVASMLWAQQTATVSAITGKVEYRATPTASWQAARVGVELPLGTTISTSFGARATVQFGFSTLQIEPLSRLTLEDLVQREGAVDTSLRLNVGRVRAEVRDAGGLEQNFQLRSTQATAAVRGTEFSFDGVNVQVFSGAVTMLNRFNQGSTVGGGEQSSVPEDDPPPSGGDYLEQLLAVIPYAPGSEERQTGSGDGSGSEGPVPTGGLMFNFYYY